MTEGLDRLSAALADGSAGGVKITTRKGEPWITVPKLEPLDELDRTSTETGEQAERKLSPGEPGHYIPQRLTDLVGESMARWYRVSRVIHSVNGACAAG